MLNLKLILIVVYSTFFSAQASALLDVGVGYGATTSGRMVPALAAGISGSGWALGGYSTGVQSNLYFQSGYLVSGLKTFEAGKFFGGSVQGGVGIGGYYSQRGYRTTASGTVEKSTDSVFGPAFRSRWLFTSNTYLGLDFLYGVRDFGMLLNLVGQDVTLFSLGVSL